MTAWGKKFRKVAYSMALLTLILMVEGRLQAQTSVQTQAVLSMACPNGMCQEDHSGALVVDYFGVGAMVIQVRETALLFDPFFVSQPWWHLLDMEKDPALVETRLAAFLPRIKGALVGHAHYDHALNVPEVADLLPDEIPIAGSRTLFNLVQSRLGNQRFISVNELWKQGDGRLPGLSPNVEVDAIPSTHAPQVAGINLLAGIYEEPWPQVPDSALNWKQGENISWQVQFKGNEAGESYKIFVQTSPSEPPAGQPTMEGPIDLLVVAAASFNHIEEYPDALIRQLQPRVILLCHWENFFKPWYEAVEPLPLLDREALLERVRAVMPEGSEVIMPLPGSRLILQQVPRN